MMQSLRLATVAIGLPFVGTLPVGTAEEIPWERRVEDLIREGRPLDAAALAKAKAQDPASAGVAHGWLGRVSVATAQFEEAARHFSKARELGADITDIAGPFSRSLLKIGRREDACDVLRRSVFRHPPRRKSTVPSGKLPLGAGPVAKGIASP